MGHTTMLRGALPPVALSGLYFSIFIVTVLKIGCRLWLCVDLLVWGHSDGWSQVAWHHGHAQVRATGMGSGPPLRDSFS